MEWRRYCGGYINSFCNMVAMALVPLSAPEDKCGKEVQGMEGPGTG